MTVTDIVTFILSIFFLARGSSRGFLNSLAAPFSIIVATIASILFYQATKNIILSSLIGLLGPLVLSLFFKFLLKTWARATNSDVKPDFLSRLGGAILTFIWGWVFILFGLILLTVMPTWGGTMTAVHNDVSKSFSYMIVKPWEENLFAGSRQNTAAITNAVVSDNAKSLAEDPRFEKVLQDPDIQKEIDAHDMVKLMSNPKMMGLVQQIMNDPETMKKVMAVYKSQTQPQVSTNP